MDTTIIQGTDALQNCMLWVAIGSLISLVIGIIIGKLKWGKYTQIAQDQSKKMETLEHAFEKLERENKNLKFLGEEYEKDLQKLNKSLVNSEAENLVLLNQINELEDKGSRIKQTSVKIEKRKNVTLNLDNEIETGIPAPSIDSPSFTKMEKRNMEISPIRKYLKDDNFQIFEGINPKVEAILKKAAFYRWEDLARASYTELKIVMHDAGPRFRVHNPRSWSKQAKLALEDKWAELIDFQKEINAIENNSLGLINHSKVENILASSKGLAK